jgi:hypothetical protein
MTHFTRLTYRSGAPVMVNSDLVLFLEARPVFHDGEPWPSQTKIVFALPGRGVSDAGETETEPYFITVAESPEDVMALMCMRLDRVPDLVTTQYEMETVR